MKLSDVVGCAGGAVSLLLASMLIPFVGPFFSLLTPLPFLFYSVRLGPVEGLKVTALVVAGIGLAAQLLGYSQIIILAVEFSVVGMVLAGLFRRGLSLGMTIFLATLVMLLLGLGTFAVMGLSGDTGPVDMLLRHLQGHLDAAIHSYGELNPGSPDTAELNAHAKAFMATLSQIYPSLMIVGTGFALWLNVVIARPLFRMGNLAYPRFIPMDRWQAPDHLVWGLIASGFALFLPSDSIQFLAVNVLIVILAIYLFHGLSIILFFLNKFRVPSWLRIAIYFLIVVQQLLMAVLTFVGLFDQWIDFRKIHRRADRQPTS